jgi:chromosomal replication initiator protein
MATEVIQELDPGAEGSKPISRGSCSVEQVAEIVAERFDLQPSDLRGPNRSASVAWARQVAMYLCRQHTRSSTSSIGAYFGGRTHSAVLYAARRTEERMASEPESDQEVRMLSAGLAGDVRKSAGDRSC